MLGQILTNLFGNAHRRVPDRGRNGVALKRVNEHVVLNVCDNGLGIPIAERQTELQRLYWLERSRHSEGNGIGLSPVEAVCELHRAALILGDCAPGPLIHIVFPLRQEGRI